MSETPTLVPEALAQYIAEHTAPEDQFLKDLKAAAREAGFPPIFITPEAASFIQVLLKLSGAHEVVEAGTLAGYSAIRMARALPEDGRVRTIEIDPERADFAEEWIARSDVAERIELHRGDAADILASFEADSSDAAFLDADKKNLERYLTEALRIVLPGGLILADNAFAFGRVLEETDGDPEVCAVRAFNRCVARHSGLHGVILPLGDGLWAAIKEEEP